MAVFLVLSPLQTVIRKLYGVVSHPYVTTRGSLKEKKFCNQSIKRHTKSLVILLKMCVFLREHEQFNYVESVHKITIIKIN